MIKKKKIYFEFFFFHEYFFLENGIRYQVCNYTFFGRVDFGLDVHRDWHVLHMGKQDPQRG